VDFGGRLDRHDPGDTLHDQANFRLARSICVHLRSSAANIGFWRSHWAQEEHTWPQMNAD
jgi:hypothetical protein